MAPLENLSGIVATPDKKTETGADRLGKWAKIDEQREARKPKGWKGFAANLWGNALVRFGLGGLVIGGGAYEAYQNVPAIHSTVDSLTGQGIPETFDNNAGRQVIKAGVNAVQATEEQVREIINRPFPLANLDIEAQLKTGRPPRLEMLFPIKGLQPGEQIEIVSGAVGALDPLAPTYRDNSIPIEDKLRGSSFFKEYRNIPQGKEIAAIIPGVKEWRVYVSKYTILEGKEYPRIIKLNAEVEGNTIDLELSADWSDFAYSEALKDAPQLDMSKGESIRNTDKEPLIIPSNDVLLIAQKANAILGISGNITIAEKKSGTPFIANYPLTPDQKALYP